jgi:hypothetical protein
LQTEIEIGVGAFDPLLHDQIGKHRHHLAAKAREGFEVGDTVGLVECTSIRRIALGGLEDYGKSKVPRGLERFVIRDMPASWHAKSVTFGHVSE